MTPKPWWLATILSRRTRVCRFSRRDAVGASQSRSGTCLGKPLHRWLLAFSLFSFPSFSVSASLRLGVSVTLWPIPSLEYSQLNLQKLLRVLPEVADQEAHIPRQPGHVVVQRRIAEHFSQRSLVRIELRGSVADICRGIAQIVVRRIIRRQLPERAFAGADVLEQRVALFRDSLHVIGHGRIVHQLA